MFNPLDKSLLEEWLNADPTAVALKTGNRVLAEQVATLAKARKKLPSYYDARCFILPLSYQQATSEVVAASRQFDTSEKGLAIDLTCGLGVDSLYLSREFEKVTTCEIDPEKAQIARHNFQLLGAENVTVENLPAEEFLSNFHKKGEKATLIFCDPARRSSAGEKRHALEDCSPNILELMPLMKECAQTIAVKLSPLFDVDELFRIFGEEIEVEVISHNGECKEVVLKLGESVQKGKVTHTIITAEQPRTITIDHQRARTARQPIFETQTAQYLYIVDVALAKSRSVEQYMAESYPEVSYFYGGFLLCDQRLENLVGREFKINTLAHYKPKELKKHFATQGIKSATFYLKNCPYNISQLTRALSLKEGGTANSIFVFKNEAGAVVVAIGK